MARRSSFISVLRATAIITLLLRVRALKLAISVLALLTSSLRGIGRVKNYGQARAVLLRVPHLIDVGNIKYICKNSGIMKNQGYNSRLDESLGARNGNKSQSMKDRRDESKAMSKKMYGHSYGADHGMKYRDAGKHIKNLIKK